MKETNQPSNPFSPAPSRATSNPFSPAPSNPFSPAPSSLFSRAPSSAPSNPFSSAPSNPFSPAPSSAPSRVNWRKESVQYPYKAPDSRELSLAGLNANLEENSQLISDKIFLCLFDKNDRDNDGLKTINNLIKKYGFDERLLKKISSKLHSDFKKILLQEIFAEDIDDGEKILSKKEYEDFFNKITHGQKIKSTIETLNERDLVKEKKLSYETGQDALILLMKLNRAVKNLSEDLHNINIINEATNKEYLQKSLSGFLDEKSQKLFSNLEIFYKDTKDKILLSQSVDEKSASSDFSLRYSSSKLAKKVPASFNFSQCKEQIKELLRDVNEKRSLLNIDYENQAWILKPYKKILLRSPNASENFPLNKTTRSASSSFLSPASYSPFQSRLTPYSAQISEEEKINQRALRYLNLGMENFKILKENLDSIGPQASNGVLEYESPSTLTSPRGRDSHHSVGSRSSSPGI